jgi:hypothetical protein
VTPLAYRHLGIAASSKDGSLFEGAD